MGDYALSMEKGADIPFTLTFKDGDGNVIDITGWTISMMIKKDINDTDANALISKVVTSHTNPTGGITTITIDRADTSDLDYGEYVYDLQIIKNDGKYKSSPTDKFIIKSTVKVGN